MMSIYNRIPPPNWLRAFEVAARHLSFTIAAQELHVTQSAISQQVRLLEGHLQEQLFLRQRRGLELTDAGRAYLEVLHKSFEQISQATDEIFGPKNPKRITLKCNVSFSTLWLAGNFVDFYTQCPDIELRITNMIWYDNSHTEGADIEIRVGDGVWPGLTSIKLLDETMTPIAHPDYLAINNVQTPEDLCRCKLLHTIGHQFGWNAWLEYAGVQPSNELKGIQFDVSCLSFEMAKKGLGVAMGLKSLRHNALANHELIKPFEIEMPVDEGFYLVLPEQGTKKPHIDEFINWIISRMQATTG